MDETELVLTSATSLIYHSRFPRARRTICGARIWRTVMMTGGRRPCARCAKFVGQ